MEQLQFRALQEGVGYDKLGGSILSFSGYLDAHDFTWLLVTN